MITDSFKDLVREMTSIMPEENSKIVALLETKIDDDDEPLDENVEVATVQALISLEKIFKRADELDMSDAELMFALMLLGEKD